MIHARLSDCSKYASVHPGLRAGFDYLQSTDFSSVPDGKHTIDGQRLFAMVSRDGGRGRDASVLEYHRKYIDIQFVVSGGETIGWRHTEQCSHVKHEYSSDRDIGFFTERPLTWCEIRPGEFVVLFPEDAHAPNAGDGPLMKIVVKVAVAWDAD